MGQQLVARGDDARRGVEAIGAGAGELPQDRCAIGGDRGPDTRDHGIIIRQDAAIIVDLGMLRADPHIAAPRVDQLDNMAPFLARLDQTACGIGIRLPGQQRDPQRPFDRTLLGQLVIGLIGENVLQAGLIRIDDHVFPQGPAAQQHPEIHGLAIGQRNLDRPGPAGHRDRCLDDVAKLGLAVRAGHLPPVDDPRRAGHFKTGILRVGLDQEPHLGIVGGAKGFNRLRVQRGGTRAGIDLGPNGRQAQFRQRKPFFPSENKRVGHGASYQTVYAVCSAQRS